MSGKVAVPDARLDKLAEIAGSAKIIETQLGFVDIAGLVRGASKGEGLGNQFLGNIREVDAIVHVLRCFENDDIQHVENKVDPIADAETVETELMLADLESLEKRVPTASRRRQQGDKEAKIAASVLGQALELLREGKPARLTEPKDDEEARHLRPGAAADRQARPLCLQRRGGRRRRTATRFRARVFEKAKAEGAKAVVVSAAIEAEIATMPPEDRGEFLAELGLEETGLARVIRAGYELLHLITFFTVGPKEARAWTVAGAPRRRRRRARSTPISSAASSAPRRSPMTITSRSRARPAQGRGQAALGRQGICRPGRRRDAVPVQCLRSDWRSGGRGGRGDAATASPDRRAFDQCRILCKPNASTPPTNRPNRPEAIAVTSHPARPPRLPVACIAASAAWWIGPAGSGTPSTSRPWTRMPPPTQIIAAVPTIDSEAHQRPASPCTSPRPMARVAARRRSARCRPISSIFTISPTTP